MPEKDEFNNLRTQAENKKSEEFTTRKRLAPPPPVIMNIDKRMKVLEDKGRRRGKRNSWIGIVSSIAILIVVFCTGYYLLNEINSIADRVEVNNSVVFDATEDPDGLCSKEDDCCLTSLSRSRKHGFMLIDELGVCPEGSASNVLKCASSLSWCEPVADEIPVAVDDLDWVDIDTSNWSIFDGSSFGFTFRYPSGLAVISEDLEAASDADISKVYVAETATSTDYFFILKIIENAADTSLEDHINAQRSVLDSLASSSGVVSALVSKNYRTENLVGKKIIVTTNFEGEENINEEVVIAGNGYLYAIAYPTINGLNATTSQINIMRGIITSFALANIAKDAVEAEIIEPPLGSNNDMEEPGQPIDSDGDGLSDNEEIIYNTDPNLFDTDGDGFSDGDEVKNGYNPAGTGLL